MEYIWLARPTPTIANNKIINCNCNYNSFNGILLENISYNAIQECTCNYNLVNSYTGSSSTVQNITVTGGGIRLNSSHNNSIEGCIANYNVTGCLSHNRGTNGTNSTGGLPAVTNCSLTGGGIDLVGSNSNTITNCSCSANVTGNMDFNIGGTGGAGTGIMVVAEVLQLLVVAAAAVVLRVTVHQVLLVLAQSLVLA